MRATVVQCRDAPVGLPEEYEWLLEQRARKQRSSMQFLRKTGDVPSIA
jgi:hypothetical protein